VTVISVQLAVNNEQTDNKMRRRILLFCLLITVLLTIGSTEAQQVAKIPRIGILTPASEPSTPVFEAFREGLRGLGYVEGKQSPSSSAWQKASWTNYLNSPLN
jgi:hypothetical protein